jgi:hypothetical protein
LVRQFNIILNRQYWTYHNFDNLLTHFVKQYPEKSYSILRCKAIGELYQKSEFDKNSILYTMPWVVINALVSKNNHYLKTLVQFTNRSPQWKALLTDNWWHEIPYYAIDQDNKDVFLWWAKNYESTTQSYISRNLIMELLIQGKTWFSINEYVKYVEWSTHFEIDLIILNRLIMLQKHFPYTMPDTYNVNTYYSVAGFFGHFEILRWLMSTFRNRLGKVNKFFIILGNHFPEEPFAPIDDANVKHKLLTSLLKIPDKKICNLKIVYHLSKFAHGELWELRKSTTYEEFIDRLMHHTSPGSIQKPTLLTDTRKPILPHEYNVPIFLRI